MQKLIKGKPLCFFENYFASFTKKYWALEKKKLKIWQFLSSLVFCNYVTLGEHILIISKTIFTKLILHLRLKNRLPDVLLQEFYILYFILHSTHETYQVCIYNILILEKCKFWLLLKSNLLFFFECK